MRAAPGPRPKLLLLTALGVLALLLALPAGPLRAAETGRDLEPAPPWIFFPDPDPETAQEISEIVENSFGDMNKTALARDLLVERYGLWSVDKLFLVLKQESNESRTWNSALTAYALRDRLGNAPQLWRLLEPLVDLADRSAEPYRRAFAALALGSFHGPDFIPPPPRHPDPLIVRQVEDEARRYLSRGMESLGRLISDGNPHVEVAAALSLGKSGAPEARELLRAADRLGPTPKDRDIASVEARMASLVAVGLLPHGGDDGLFVHQLLRDEKRRIRAAAALGIALQAVADPMPTWIGSPELVFRALRGPRIEMALEDGAEATFARGVLAARTDARAEWRDLFDLAVTPSTEESTKRAAAQVLLFCTEPWLLDQAAEMVRKRLDPVVTAAFLLLLGTEARPEGIEICADWLSSQGKYPKAKSQWDVRYYAAIGLLRALASGRITDLERRAAIFEALDQGVSRGLARSSFRDALEEILDSERRGILESPSHIVADRRLAALESTFVDVDGLLARDLKDVVVTRLNEMVPNMFNVNSLRPGEPGNRDKSEIPRRFLATCHARYPYFSRLDLLADRGRRERASMPAGDDPDREVRRP